MSRVFSVVTCKRAGIRLLLIVVATLVLAGLVACGQVVPRNQSSASSSYGTLPVAVQTGEPQIPLTGSPAVFPTGVPGIMASPSPAVSPVPVRAIGGGNYGTWVYTATRGGSVPGVVANVHYDTDSVAGLQSYAAANRALAIQLANSGRQIDAKITFRTYMSPDQFRAWCRTASFQPQYSLLRATDPTKANQPAGRVGLGIAAQGTDPLPQAHLDQLLITNQSGSYPPAQKEYLRLQGVFEADGRVEAAQLHNLVADPLVFLVDVTSAVIKDNLAAQGVATAGQVNAIVLTPFGYMEALGLDNFR